MAKPDPMTLACECDQIVAALTPPMSAPGSPVPVGAGDLGLVLRRLSDAAALLRAGSWLAAFSNLKLAFDEAWEAFTGPVPMGAGEAPAKGKWSDLLAKLLPLLVQFLPLFL